MTGLKSLCRRISQFEWLILLTLFPVIILLTPEQAPILLLMPLLWGIRWLGSGRLFPSTPINWPLHLLLIMSVVNLFVTSSLDKTLPMVGGLIFGISLYYALTVFGGHSRRRLFWLLGGFVLAGAGITLLGLLHPTLLNRLTFFQSLTGFFPAGILRFPGDDDGFNANRISGTLLWVAPLTWVLATTRLAGEKEVIPGWLSAVLTPALFLLALIMTLVLMFLFSRAAQVAYAVTVALLFGLLVWKHRWLIVLAVFAFLAAWWFLVSSDEYRLQVQQFVLTISGETTGGSTAVESFAGRMEIWERGYYVVQDFPLTGAGMNNFPAVMQTFYPPLAFRSAGDITHTHNQLLIIGTDLGLPGLIAYVALLIGLAGMLWQCWRHGTKRPEPERLLALGFAASLLAFELFGLFDGIGLGEKPAVFFWFLVGLSGALYSLVHPPTLPKSAILTK